MDAHGCKKERVIVPRRFQGNAPPPAKDGPRINDEITAKTIFLIGDDGHKYGEIGLDEALALGEEKGFDVVVDVQSTVFFKPALDLTTEAIAAYDKAYPAK